jgi:hypothetical protein
MRFWMLQTTIALAAILTLVVTTPGCGSSTTAGTGTATNADTDTETDTLWSCVASYVTCPDGEAGPCGYIPPPDSGCAGF